LLDIDYGAEKEGATGGEDDMDEVQSKMDKDKDTSTLSKSVQQLISLLFNINTMKDTLKEMEIDIKKMPLGKLTKKQIKEGYDVLKQIETELNGKNKKSVLSKLSSRFYTLVPQAFGRRVPPTIDDSETLRSKMNLLEALADIEIATNIIKEGKGQYNIIDSNYEKLKCKMEPVSPTSDEFKDVLKYVKNSQHGGQKIQLLELFKIERENEAYRFEPTKAYGNRRLLWHGSRLTNFAGILSQGLRIAPPEAPVTGYRFGKGIYFADIMTLSSNYCRVTSANGGIGCMLLSDVSLGQLYKCPRDKYMDKPPSPFHSTWALGKIEPDPKENVTTPDGCIIPSGKIIPSGITDCACHEHQYIVYGEEQSYLKYLLKLKFPV